MRIKSEKIVGLCRRDISRLLTGGTLGTYMFHIAWDKKYDDLALAQKGTLFDECANILINGGEIMITDLFADGLGRWVNGMLIVKSNDFHNGNNLKTSIERVVTTNSLYLCSTEVYYNPTYHVSLNDILNVINMDNSKPYIEKGLLDKIGDYKHSNALLQLIAFNEIVYDL